MPASVKLPTGMRIYSFMFGDKLPLVPMCVATGTVPVPSSLLVGMSMGVGLTAIRLLLDFAVFKPLARRVLGIFPDACRNNSPVAALDALCAKSKVLSSEDVERVSRESGLSREEVNDYMRRKMERGAEDKQIGKFKEAAWRLLVYCTLVGYGLKVAYGQPWFKDPLLVWDGWPAGIANHNLEMYYHFSMGVYWHFASFQFYDTRRSDFYQMLLHHVATLFLLCFSWLVSLVRIGTLVMLVHDVSDVFMEMAKLFNYAQKRYPWCHLVADVVFFIFAGVFGVSRLYLYPRYMVWNVWTTDALSPVCRMFFCGLLVTLQILHIFWFYLILRMIYMFVFHGVEEDIRSDNGEKAIAKGGSHARSNGNKPKTA